MGLISHKLNRKKLYIKILRFLIDLKICVFTQKNLRFPAIKMGIYTDFEVMFRSNFVLSYMIKKFTTTNQSTITAGFIMNLLLKVYSNNYLLIM
jgi:hypothetical protein